MICVRGVLKLDSNYSHKIAMKMVCLNIIENVQVLLIRNDINMHESFFPLMFIRTVRVVLQK